MTHLVEVAFKGNRKEFFFWEADELPPRAAPVIVDADRGEDLGRVLAVGPEAELRSAKVPHGLFGAPAPRGVKRVATSDDLRRLADARAEDDDARRRAAERVKANALVMKVTDAEWQWDRKKLTFYFTAEKRVDFRTLVRELASMFRTRIELKQIGVRDEARRLDGVGRCGRQYCSASWLPELRPVNLGVAKDQRLSLNPSQISGACGRLMCCLRYEHDFYVQSRRKYPKETKIVRTGRGEEKVVANDIFRERVTLRGVDGETRTIALAELRAELTAAGEPIAAALEAAALEHFVALPAREHHQDHPHHQHHQHDATDEHPVFVEEPVATAQIVRTRPPRESAAAAAPAVATAVAVSPALPAPPASPIDGDGDAPTPPEQGVAADGDRRPPRRRGRRGGRRNRPGGAPGLPATSAGGGADTDAGGDAEHDAEHDLPTSGT